MPRDLFHDRWQGRIAWSRLGGPPRLPLNPPQPLVRPWAALEERGGLAELLATPASASEAVTQAGVNDPASVRLAVKENRRLSPMEVQELVAAYQAGASQVELARRYGTKRQTVWAHLRRQGATLRPQQALTAAQELEVVRLYVKGGLSLVEVAARFGVGYTTVQSLLMGHGVRRRPRGRRAER